MNEQYGGTIEVNVDLFPPQLREIYDSQLSDSEFITRFSEEVNYIRSEIFSAMETVKDVGGQFDLNTWVDAYTDYESDNIVKNSTLGFRVLAVKMMALYYVLKNLRSDIEGNLDDSDKKTFMIETEAKSNLEENLEQAMHKAKQFYDHFIDSKTD